MFVLVLFSRTLILQLFIRQYRHCRRKTGRKRDNTLQTELNADSAFLPFTMFSQSGQTLLPSDVAVLPRKFDFKWTPPRLLIPWSYLRFTTCKVSTSRIQLQILRSLPEEDERLECPALTSDLWQSRWQPLILRMEFTNVSAVVGERNRATVRWN